MNALGFTVVEINSGAYEHSKPHIQDITDVQELRASVHTVVRPLALLLFNHKS